MIVVTRAGFAKVALVNLAPVGFMPPALAVIAIMIAVVVSKCEAAQGKQEDDTGVHPDFRTHEVTPR
jgi:hypothetical protein